MVINDPDVFAKILAHFERHKILFFLFPSLDINPLYPLVKLLLDADILLVLKES